MRSGEQRGRIKRPVRSVVWPVVEAGAGAVLGAVAAFTLARLVGPAELGIGAAAVAVHVLLWIWTHALFADALTQSRSTDPRALSSAVWAAGLMGVAAAAAQAASGLLLVALLDDPRLLPMSLTLAVALPFVGAAGAVQGLLTRARRYDVLAARAVGGQGLGLVVGVGVALAGGGAWAIVTQQAAASLGGAALLLARADWRPVAAWRWAPVRDLLRLGVPVATSALVQQGRYRLFLLVLGGMAGPAALGQLHLAFRLVDTAREVMGTALWRLLLPGLSERRDDPAGLRAGMEQALAGYAPVVFPVCAALLLVVEPAALLLLGPAWAEAGAAAPPLVVLMAWALLGAAAAAAVVARGAGLVVLGNNLGVCLLVVLGVVLVQPGDAAAAVLVWLGAHLLAAPWIAWRNALVLETTPARLYRAGLPALLASTFAVLAGWFLPLALGMGEAPLALMAARLGFGGLAYLPYAVVFLRADLRAFWQAGRNPRRPVAREV